MVVVFFKMPVARPEVRTPLMPFTVIASEPAVLVTSPVCAGSCAACNVPLSPVDGIEVAAIVPDPLTPKEAPVPTSITAEILVPPVSVLNALPPPADPQSEPVPEISPDVFTCKHWVEPVMPVSVSEVAVAAPMLGVTSVGEFERTGNPVPVVVWKTSCPDIFDPKTKALVGTAAPFTLAVFVALIVPDPLAARLAPVPTTMAAWAFVPEVRALKELDPIFALTV